MGPQDGKNRRQGETLDQPVSGLADFCAIGNVKCLDGDGTSECSNLGGDFFKLVAPATDNGGRGTIPLKHESTCFADARSGAGYPYDLACERAQIVPPSTLLFMLGPPQRQRSSKARRSSLEPTCGADVPSSGIAISGPVSVV